MSAFEGMQTPPTIQHLLWVLPNLLLSSLRLACTLCSSLSHSLSSPLQSRFYLQLFPKCIEVSSPLFDLHATFNMLPFSSHSSLPWLHDITFLFFLPLCHPSSSSFSALWNSNHPLHVETPKCSTTLGLFLLLLWGYTLSLDNIIQLWVIVDFPIV